ncbi:MAG: carbon storage regulator [Rhodopirellula sp.]|nr:carbon storage regulator [Rhodopirellula sp.]
MLVLTRKLDEGIVIEGGIRITVLKIRGSQIQLGIDAPKDVIIRRSELEDSGTKPVVAVA